MRAPVQKRRRALIALLAVASCGLVAVAAAFGASSPTVTTGPASNVADTSAVVSATIDPNGRSTSYTFSYGPTTAYGSATAARSIGSGSKVVTVQATITGLSPGTVYHYRVSALSSAGSSTGADHSFTTTGFQPAAVVTGAAIGVSQTAATPTGTVNPEGTATTWVVQYGLTDAYGYETFPQQLSAVNQALPVTGALVGLAPATLFHYRIVAYHGTTASVGADQTFFTKPLTPPVPKLRARTTPAVSPTAPYRYTTQGTIGGAGAIPAAQRCAGTVGIRYYDGNRQVAFAAAPVDGSCGFSAPVSVTRLRGPAPAVLTVRVWYRGTGYVAHAVTYDRVTAG